MRQRSCWARDLLLRKATLVDAPRLWELRRNSIIQLKLEFLDSYKNKPANPALKKNDTAFVTAFVLKF
jgi:hypothetical protein